MLLLIPQRYEFSSKSQQRRQITNQIAVVADTTKVRIFKQITTAWYDKYFPPRLLLIPQRYEFSSKSQRWRSWGWSLLCCCWYHKGTNFQANHNPSYLPVKWYWVVADTTKVRIFKQITTKYKYKRNILKLLLIPQRYEFSSKSQPILWSIRKCCSCCWYHKGTNFQANHNLILHYMEIVFSCCWYHKGTNFQANHNYKYFLCCEYGVVADTTKVRIFKQITTQLQIDAQSQELLLIPQRYEFSSKSQRKVIVIDYKRVVADTTKVRIFKQITTYVGYLC